MVPEELPEELRKSPAFNVEVDVLPGDPGSARRRSRDVCTGESIRDAVHGDFPLRKLFTKDQKAFYKEHAPEGIELDALQVLGPTFVMKSVFIADELGRRVVAELWLYPDGSRILELSTKCLPNEAFQVAAESRAYLASRGITVEIGGQQTKTKTALEFFSAHLLAGAAADPVDDALGAIGTGAAGHATRPEDDEDDDVLRVPEVFVELDDEDDAVAAVRG